MDSAGWIKLHRKTLQNELFEHDKTALSVFIHLLLVVDRQGKWQGGRFQLADLCKINPSTLYNALQRLNINTIINIKSNNKFSTISICNWSKYQMPVNNKISRSSTTGQQQRQHSNKNAATKNKESRREIVEETSPGYIKAKEIREKLRLQAKAI